MIDHLLGRPSNEWKRSQVLLVVLFWAAAIFRGNKNGPPIVRWFSRKIRDRLTPWQVITATLTCLYAVKNADALLGLQAPEPLSRLYSRDFYRATWIVTALDAGFATTMHIKPKWLRDITAIIASGYYCFFANEGDEKLRKYRAFCTVEMLRSTWQKTSNPILRAVTRLSQPRIAMQRDIILPRLKGSPYSKHIAAVLYFDGTDHELAASQELLLDLPGGGFVCMDPRSHDDRLLYWAKHIRKPILALDYSKAPEYPYPYAMHECFDVYRLLHETKGSVIGMRSDRLRVVLSGDSAGANLGAALMIKLLEMPAYTRPPLPLSVIWTYPALDFNFTSFMPPDHLRILRQESSSSIRGIAEQKDHLKHQSPLAMVEDSPNRHRRKVSWTKSFSRLPLVSSLKSPSSTPTTPTKRLPNINTTSYRPLLIPTVTQGKLGDGNLPQSTVVAALKHPEDADSESDETCEEAEKAIAQRIQYWNPDLNYAELEGSKAVAPKGKQMRTSALGTRLTMTSRTGFFSDRIISPSMMRAMAICYIGPRNSPDLSKNYYISPILTPAAILAQYPPVYLLCGERDPFSDDTLLFCGRLRDAKLARKAELQAQQNKHGEGLRMSTAAKSSLDPILEENEDDWVTMRFIEGWSHGFMQMRTLLPNVEHFFALTSSWALESFEKNLPSFSAQLAPTRPQFSHESASETEADVLSFTPRRRGSRASSPMPPSNIRQQMQDLADAALAESLSNAVTSASTSDAYDSTAATSVASLDQGMQANKARRPSPIGNLQKGAPPRQAATGGSDRSAQSKHSLPSDIPSSSGESAIPHAGHTHRGSDAVAGATFVEAVDLLKRRREDAIIDLGSALADDSE